MAKSFRLKGLAKLRTIAHDMAILKQRREALHVDRPDFKDGEPLTEREFVNKFGTKVAHVRYSRRVDFVGLMVLGKNVGFMVVKHGDKRRLRLVDVAQNGRVIVTHRYIELRRKDSLSNLWRGLLNYVQ